MKPNGYAYQLRTLRQLERQRNLDLTGQAMSVFYSRQKTIDATAPDPETRQRWITAALLQWKTFMQRDMPAVG